MEISQFILKLKALYLLLLLSFFLQISCKNKNAAADQKPIAKAFDKYLYASEISNIIPKGFSKEDSILTVSNYVDMWLKKQLLYQKAEENLSTEQKDVEQQLEEYRVALLTYKYKQKFVTQRLDTIVNEKDIEAFYNQHSNEFKLSNSIIKAYIVRLPISDPKKKEIFLKLNKTDETNINFIKNYCYQNNGVFQDVTKEWVYFYNIIAHIPLKIENAEDFIQKHSLTQVEANEFVYMIKIESFKLKNETTPFEMEKENIKSIILNKKKNELIIELERNIYKDALNNKDIEIYNKQK